MRDSQHRVRKPTPQIHANPQASGPFLLDVWCGSDSVEKVCSPALQNFLGVVSAVIRERRGGTCAVRKSSPDILVVQPTDHRDSAPVTNNQERKQTVKRHGRNDAQIDGRNRFGMIAQECLPALGRRPAPSGHVFRDRRLRDLETQLQQLPVDARGAPKHVVPAHLPDQITQTAIDFRSPCPLARLPTPVGSKPHAMPPQHRLGPHDLDRVSKVRPKSDQASQDGTINPAQP